MINLSGVRASLRDPMVAVVIIACSAPSASAIRAQQAGDTANFIGSWVGCDGQTVNFAYGGDEHTGQVVGNCTKLGSLGRFHFEENQVGYEAEQRSANEYTGQVKWRSVDGNVFWKPNEITISGDNYFDNGSDPCARTMWRVAD